MGKVLLLIAIIILVMLVRVLRQELFSPAVINVYWNIFFVFGAVILFGAGIEWEYAGVYWILLSCAACLIGQVIGGAISLPETKARGNLNRNYVYIILFVIIVLGIIQPLIYLNAFGYSVSDLFNIRALLQLNTEVAYDRYYGHKFSAPAISSVLSIIIYMGALIGGYVFPMLKNVLGKLLALATMVPILFLAIITNAKVGVIASVFLWVIGWILHSLNEKRTGKILSKKIIVIGFFVAVLGIVFLDLTMVLRIGSIDMETQMIVNDKLQEYAFGQVHSFSIWFQSQYDANLELGSNTYMFLTNWLGFTVRKQGVYDLMLGVVSNIYTQNRGIIMDFGVLGGLVYWMVMGVISGLTYKKVKSGAENCIGSMLILGSIYFMMLYGFIISPWIYSSYVLAFIGFGIFLVMLKIFKFSFKR